MRKLQVPAADLHRISNTEALTEVRLLLGRADEQLSALLRYRFESEWQADWLAEVGHWLHTASRLGFIEPLWDRVVRRSLSRGDDPENVDPNDPRHRMLTSDLAPAKLVHYLAGAGWKFDAWEPPRLREDPDQHIDVDVSLIAPDGTPVDVQVKAPDRPGRRVNGRVVDGEEDDSVIAALDTGARQLPRMGPQAKMLAVCAQRDWPLILDPSAVVGHVLGSSTQYEDDSFWLPRPSLGRFSTPDWEHISAVLFLDMFRAATPSYGSIVVLNPWAEVKAKTEWFPSGWVCFVDSNDIVRWLGGHPTDCSLREGTRIVDALP
jgi:hypothetical protein